MRKEACVFCQLNVKKIAANKGKVLIELAEMYLGVLMTDDTALKTCLNCYKTIEDFHHFKQIVLKNYEDFKKYNSIPIQTDEEIFNSKTDIESIKNEDCESPELLESKNTKRRRQIHTITKDEEQDMIKFYDLNCENCSNLKFNSFKELRTHYSTVHKTEGYIKCCSLRIRVKDRSYLRSHMMKHLQPETCRCTICKKELSSVVKLNHHMNVHKSQEERPFPCAKCEKTFCCNNDLKNHDKTQHSNNEHSAVCHICGKVFNKIIHLRYHHSVVHKKQNICVCDVCAKTFTTKTGLKSHMIAAHTSHPPIQCHLCSKWLKNKETFRRHIKLHQNTMYPCSKCDKVCNSGDGLKSHMIRHTDDRPFSCVTCQKSFKTKSHLKNHTSQHLGSTNCTSCPECGKLFMNKSNYYTHKRRMHAKSKIVSIETSNVKLSNNLLKT